LLLLPAHLPARDVPDFGVILNDDGDLLFLHWDAEASMRATRASLDALRGTPVKTLMLSVGAGSDILHYDTKVASIYGWRETTQTRKVENPKNEDEMWHPRIVKERTAIQGGTDAIRVAGEYARSMGMRFFPSYRMNDDHFMFTPFEYPLTGEFWIQNHERLKIGTHRSPILSDKHYGNLFDFSHKEVRDFRLAVIREVVDRYGDISDGIELDFNRVQVLFPRGEAESKAHLVTDLVRQVRGILDEAGRKHGRDFYLVVRVPPTLKNCRWAGLEVEKWIGERLVDVVAPSQLMTLAHDMPVDEFVKLAKPVGCKVYPSLYPRTSYQWPFTAGPSPEAYARPASRDVVPALVRGAAQNYRAMGADGFELFNFHHEDMAVRPFSDRLYRIFRDLSDPKALTIADKVFQITPAYYLDHEDTYEYRKQVPVSLSDGRRQQLTLVVGEDFADPLVKDVSPYVALRLGFSAFPESARLDVTLNGHTLGGSLGHADVVVAKGKHPPAAPSAFVQIPVTDLSIMRRGNNEITVAMSGLPATDATTKPAANDGVKLAEVQLGVIYDRQYLDLLYK
jgi:hypothetical protein